MSPVGELLYSMLISYCIQPHLVTSLLNEPPRPDFGPPPQAADFVKEPFTGPYPDSGHPPQEGDDAVVESFGRLSDSILQSLAVQKKIPPYLSGSDIIFLYFKPLQIIRVNEVEQSVYLSVVLEFKWRDPNIRWNPRDYGNINELEIPTSSIWTPKILLPLSTYEGQITMPDDMNLGSDGTVQQVVPGFINTLCQLDMTQFPFDQHTCTVIFTGRHRYKLEPGLKFRAVDMMQQFCANSEWILVQSGCSSQRGPSKNTQLECFVTIRRRSAFYVANLIVPMFLTSVMTLIVFWIPAESGEKVSFLVSVYVSTSVFLNYIVEVMPRNMDSLARLNALLVFVVVKIIMATVATATVLQRYKHEKRRQSSEMRTNYNDITSTKSQNHKKNPKESNVEDDENHHVSFSNSVIGSCELYSTAKVQLPDMASKPTSSGSQWKRLANTVIYVRGLSHDQLDKLFFTVLFCVTVFVYIPLVCF